MQQHLSLLNDVRGCLTRLDSLTVEIVTAQSDAGLTHDEMKAVLAERGIDIEKVVFGGSRSVQNAFYGDYEQRGCSHEDLGDPGQLGAGPDEIADEPAEVVTNA